MRTLALFFVLLSALPAHAQDMGGGPDPLSTCITDPQREAVRAALAKVHLPPVQTFGAPTLYADPMGGGGTNSFGKTLVNYVDLDPTAGLLDWNCGTTTYDGHQGNDIEIASFYDMDEGVPVLCAAPGTVVYTHDGEFDRNSVQNPAAIGNAVIVQHADGSQALYWHFRKNSVRVSVGQMVATGDTLGMVGSSGYSSGPHIHFETQDGGTVDPYHGSCQAGPSWWISQPPNVWTLPFQLFDHGVTTMLSDWATILEKPPSKTHVKGPATIYSWVRLRNAKNGIVLTWKLYRDGALVSTRNLALYDYSSSWWYLSYYLGSNYGNIKIDILQGAVLLARQQFTYDNIPNQTPSVPEIAWHSDVDVPIEDEFAGTDPDGSIFWYNVSAAPHHGTLELFGGRRRKFRYTPDPGFIGRDSAYVYATDDENKNGALSKQVFEVGGVSAVGEPVVALGVLHQPWPNPLKDRTQVSYDLAAPARVALDVFDAAGKRVRQLDAGERGPGAHQLTWDGRDTAGHALRPGVYLVRLQAGAWSETRRIALLR